MKIKYQSGGVVAYTPFIPNAGTSTQSGSTKSSDKQEKITGTLQEEIIKVLKENGIQSDVDSFLSQASAFLDKSQHLSSMSLFGGDDSSYTMSDLIVIMSMANRVKQNKLQWDTAAANLKDQGAWDEVAITSGGQLYVYSDKGLQTISVDEYHKNSDKYQPLTNSQILGLREKDSNLAFNSDILKDVAGTVGFEKITEELLSTISKFSATSRAEYINKTGNNISQSAWNGLQVLINEGPDGYYKATTKSEIVNMQSAMDYLWKSLGVDGQKRLRAEIAVSGGDPTKNRYDLIAQMLEHHTDFSQDVNFDKSATDYDPDGDKKAGSKTGSESLVEGTLPIEVARGNLTETTFYMSPVAQRVSDKAMMAFKAWNAGQLQDRQGDVLHANNLQDLLPHVYQAKSADTSIVVFGNQLLNPTDTQGIVWDGSSLATRVALPKKYINGKQVPDFDLMLDLNELNAWLSDNPGATSLQINQEMKDLESEGVYYDEETKTYTIDESRMGLFLAFSGYGSSDLLDISEDSKPFLQKISRQDGNKFKDQFNNLVQYGKMSPSKQDKPKNNFGKSERGDFYYGNIYIPIVDPMQATLTTRNQLYSKSSFVDSVKQNELGQQMLQAQQQSNWKKNF